jgi:hypothetical protein
VFIESSPALLQQWFADTLARLISSSNTPPILFINAWNESAEGSHLEPDQRHGLQYLEAVPNALAESKTSTSIGVGLEAFNYEADE